MAHALQDWEHKLARARESLDDDQSRLFMHFIVSETMGSEIDRSAGYVCATPPAGAIGIEEEIVVIGMYDR